MNIVLNILYWVSWCLLVILAGWLVVLCGALRKWIERGRSWFVVVNRKS